MSVYFENFPKTTHTGQLVRDITRRAALTDTVLNDKYAYLPYLIKEDDRPEDVANFYYGSVRYTWLVYYSVGVLDPYFDWPLNSVEFENYLIDKYADQANTTGYDVIAWTQNTGITENIVHYENDEGDKITPDTYDLSESITASDWTAVRYFDYELGINDDKRVINLLERSYKDRAEKELRDLLNDGLV